MLTHYHIFKKGHLIKETGDLKGPGQSQPRNLVRLQSLEVSTLEEDIAFGKRKLAVDAVEQGCLACSIGSNETDDLAFGDTETHLAKGIETPEGLGDRINL